MFKRVSAGIAAAIADPRKKVIPAGAVLSEPSDIKRQIALRGELHLEAIDADGNVTEIEVPNTLTDNLRKAVASLLTGGSLGPPSQISLGTGGHSSISYLDTNVTSFADLTAPATTRAKLGQVFGANGAIPAFQVPNVALWLKRLGSPGGQVYAEIYAVTPNTNGGVPTGSPISVSNSIATSAISTTAGWVAFTFTTPATLTNTSYYAIVLSSTGGYVGDTTTNYMTWGYDSTPGYGNGKGVLFTTSWGTFGSTDFAFIVVAKPDASFTDIYGSIFSKNLTSASTPGETTARLLTNFSTSEGNGFIGHAGLKDAAGNLLAITNTAYVKDSTVSLNAYWVIGVN